jgi:hypothetical protein
MIVPIGTQGQVKEILKGLSDITDVSKWYFVFAPQMKFKTITIL